MKGIRSINQAILFLAVFLTTVLTHAQIPDPDQGLRADWMRGSYGLNWKPAGTANGKCEIESFSITPFLDQIKSLKTVDYIQVHLGESFTTSPVHLGPHDLLEILWQGDTDSKGDPINLVVPRAASGTDPFLEILNHVRDAGLKAQVYVNSSNMLERWRTIDDSLQRLPNPAEIPNITERWKNWCDTSTIAQTFIASKTYHTDPDWPERPYMFCYAEFVLKDYAIRYGKLIDAWLFDTGRMMWQYNGDNRSSDSVEEQRIYQAFADACHAGNPYAAIAFNNSPGSSDLVNNPFSDATLFDDYMFGHPFNGGKNLGDVEANYFSLQWIADRNGYVHTDDGKSRTWDDKVLGHFDPPMATGRWNYGDIPALTNEEFVDWYSLALLGGGAMSPGIPLLDPYNWDYLIMEDWALEQLNLLDDYLMQNQFPGAPNWARQSTILPPAYSGQAYFFALVDGIDFWDPEGDAITNLHLLAGDPFPSWLSITESETSPRTYILGGIPTETDSVAYSFNIRIEDASGGTNREVELKVLPNAYEFTDPGDGSPVWYADTLQPVRAKALDSFNILLVQGRDFYDFEGDGLTISEVDGTEWLNLDEVSQGIWEMSGVPPESAVGTHYFSLSLSDGLRSTLAVVQLTVDPLDHVYSYTHLQIKAAADTSYGINSAATMISDIQTAADSLATFRISVDVTPGEGKAITSGITGGFSSSRSWGLGGDGREDTKIALFFGDSADWVDIGNIQIIDFNANGGLLSVSDFRDIAFDSLTLVNAQSANKDAVSLIENGVNRDLGNLAGTPGAIAIAAAGNFSLGSGDSPDQSKNKWSVEGIGVKYDMGLFHLINCVAENGSVLKTPDQKAYPQGTLIKLVAIPDPDYQFDGWSGDTISASISADTMTLLMDADKRITASFSPITTIGNTHHPFYFTISPNPSNGIFRVHMDQLIKASYIVYSIKGAKLKEGMVNGSFEFDLSSFKKGVYLLKLESEFGVEVKKIMLN